MNAVDQTVSYESEDAARQALIETCLRFAPLGLNQGKSGNASLRWHRGAEPGLLITPSGLPYERTTIDDIVWVPLDQPLSAAAATAVLEPPARFDGRLAPSSEWRMHRDLLASRDAMSAVVHVHSPYATTLACLPRIHREGVPAFHYMIAVAGGTDLRCAAYATFGTQALSDAALDALGPRRACLLANHGQLALGVGLEEALSLALEVETLSRLYWQALQIGEPVLLDAAEMARVQASFSRYGRALAR